nr:MAG TPA: hyaluronidase [Caudoviricetes sp.]
MPEKIINSRLQFLNDTAEALSAQGTAVPKAGEPVYENDTRKLKIGDGVTPLSDLKYFGGESAQNFDVTPNEGEEDVAAITRVAGSAELHTGDTAIVKRAITEDKTSYTAYVYDGTWKAMDGNYRADNVYFDDDLTYTVAIGTLSKPSGSAKFSAKGKSVEQVLSGLMAQEANPSKSNPAVSFSSTGGLGTFEIGTTKNLTYTATLSAGGYTYGPATGITAQTWEVTCNGETKTTATGTFEGVVAEATAKKITAKATYNDGAIPVTNLGNQYPAGQIKAGTASKDSGNLIGVRHMFYGVVKSADFALDSAHIRSLKHEAAAKKTISTFTAGDGALKVVVACPAGYNVTKVTLPSAMGADATADFVKQGGTVQVEGAEGYTAAAYSVWVFEPASIPSTQSYSIVIG